MGNAVASNERAFGQDIAAAIGAHGYQKQVDKVQQADSAYLKTIIQKRNEARTAGRDTSHWDKLLKNYKPTSVPSTSDVFPALKKTNAQVLRDAAGVGADVLSGGTLRSGAAATKVAAIGSTGKIGETYLKTLGGVSQKSFKTAAGTRVVDQFVNGVAHESKVGYTALTASAKTQIAKDTALVKSGQANQAVWHFFTSPTTGKVGPSAPLKNALDKAGIQIKLH